MDFLSQDPDIAPELVILLTEKLKKAKSALDLMDQVGRLPWIIHFTDK